MNDRHAHIGRAALAILQTAREAKFSIEHPVCRLIAAAVIDCLPDLRWYVGTTHDRQEGRASKGLREQGFVVYHPLTFKRVEEGRRVRAEPESRFPGYITIGFDPRFDAFDVIRSTPGMDDSSGSALITSGGVPSPLPANIISKLRQIESEEYFRARQRKKPEPRNDLVPGEIVEIIDSGDAFFGMQGTYLESPKKGIARILIGWLPKDIAELDLKKVEPLESKAA